MHLSKITGSKLFFIVEAQHADENTLMRYLAPKQNFVHEAYAQWQEIILYHSVITQANSEKEIPSAPIRSRT